jgi:hypothetical protein
MKKIRKNVPTTMQVAANMKETFLMATEWYRNYFLCKRGKIWCKFRTYHVFEAVGNEFYKECKDEVG